MVENDGTQEPGETIGEVEGARLDIRSGTGGAAKAVLFVSDGFNPADAVDFEVVKVSDETIEDMVRRRT
jgi:hypothetical protein